MRFQSTICLLFFVRVLAAGDSGRLFEAIRSGDDAVLIQMLAAGEDPNSRNPQGATLLMQAALHSKVQALQTLLKAGADPNLSNPMGATALIWAAGNTAKVRLLVNHGAQVNAAAKLGRTALIVASAFAGNGETLRFLLSKGADPKKVDANGDGPLGTAASSGDAAMMAILIAAGASVDERGVRGPAMRSMTPLMRAAAANCSPCVDLLLAHGAKPNVVSAEARRIKAGLQDLGNLSPLLLGAQWGGTAIAKSLIASGAELETRDSRGLSPLLMALTSESQDRKIVEFLLEKGARADVHSSDGQTALDWTAKWGKDTPVAKLLAARGATAGAARSTDLPPLNPSATLNPPEAALRSLKLLQSSNTTFFEKGGCVGCHHQMFTGMLAGLAKQRGLPIDEELSRQQLHTALTISLPLRESLLQRVPVGGTPMQNSLMLMALAAQKQPADALTDAFVNEIAGNQRLDGSWVSMSQRPPMEYSPATETAYAIRALRLYASSGRQAEIAERTRRAQRYLSEFQPKVTEELVMKVLGLVWTGATPDLKGLLAAQSKDGSWSQRPGFAGDAYATGQSLYALRQAGLPAGHPAYKRGVAFLLKTQYEDGSWHVPSRSVKFQPYFESGFPHGHDQWISATATAWAAMALIEAAP